MLKIIEGSTKTSTTRQIITVTEPIQPQIAEEAAEGEKSQRLVPIEDLHGK